ncbi:MAG TPA: ATP-binding protein [Methanospirillum sp.]|nr:ATP-binding protein [Methanospirillum sp.]
MSDENRKPGRIPHIRFSFPVLVMIILTTIFIVLIVLMSYITFQQTTQHLSDTWDNEVRHNEHHLKSSLQLINQGLLLFDHTFDASMKKQFAVFLDAYNQSDGNLSNINLSEIKSRFSPDVIDIADLYIINETGIVVDATYAGDIGLDFKKWPAVYKDINRIRNGSTFEADRAVYGFNSAKNSRKFAYYPTPDHRFLLEISYLISGFTEDRRNFSYANVMRAFVNEKPNIRSITLYDSMYRTLWSNSVTKTYSDPETIRQVQNTFKGAERIRISDPSNFSEVFYYFIDISDESTVSGNMLDMVARIDYDTTTLHKHLNSIWFFHVLVALIAGLLGVFIAYLLAYHITRPIHRIIDDINRIAHGDLNHRVSYSGSPEFSELETSLNLLITHLNDLISNLQEKEHHLRESKEEYQRLVERLNEGIWIVSADKITTFVNTRMAEMLEGSSDDIIGRPVFDFVHPSSHEFLREKMKNRHQGLSERYEVRLVTLTGRIIMAEISASPSFGPDGQYSGSFGVVTDITQRKENEQKIRLYARQMEERTRELETVRDELFKINTDLDRIVQIRTEEVMRLLEQKNDFIMQLGHDLRTPLTPILGLLPKLAELIGKDYAEILQIIERNARHIQSIASKSLKLARLNSLDYIPECNKVDLNEIIRTVLEINRFALIQAHIRTEVDVSEECIIDGDPILIQELIDNLVSNAIKFSKPSGGCIRIHGRADEDMVTLIISDTGIGLINGEETKIFEEFYKSDRSRHDKSSTGLGLAICRKIIQKHQGTIQASSDGPDQGTTFTIIIPRRCIRKEDEQNSS